MAKSSKFKVEVVPAEEASAELEKLRSDASSWRTSKFDPLKEHIQWLDRGSALRIDEMQRSDVANLRSYIARNLTPVSKDLEYVVRSSRIDEAAEKYRVYVFCRKA